MERGTKTHGDAAGIFKKDRSAAAKTKRRTPHGPKLHGQLRNALLNYAPYHRTTYSSIAKKIDNSRLVREADPQARGDCWSAIGAACVILALLTGVAAPSVVTNTMAGYKLESLRAEYGRLLDEKRTLQLEEAELLSPGRLEELAKKQNLVTPQSGQVVHLEDHSKPESAALIVK